MDSISQIKLNLLIKFFRSTWDKEAGYGVALMVQGVLEACIYKH